MTLLAVLAPVFGTVVPLPAVPDAVFSAAIVGPGAAVDPTANGRAVAISPVAGRVSKLYPHAFVVVTPGGAGILVHLGIDTVQLAGQGFELLAAEGADVAAGDPVVAWTPAEIRAGGRSAVSPVIALDARPDQLIGVRKAGIVAAGEPLFGWTR